MGLCRISSEIAKQAGEIAKFIKRPVALNATGFFIADCRENLLSPQHCHQNLSQPIRLLIKSNRASWNFERDSKFGRTCAAARQPVHPFQPWPRLEQTLYRDRSGSTAFCSAPDWNSLQCVPGKFFKPLQPSFWLVFPPSGGFLFQCRQASVCRRRITAFKLLLNFYEKACPPL